jgi:branched-chain amino acid transport system substrate-binding protein
MERAGLLGATLAVPSLLTACGGEDESGGSGEQAGPIKIGQLIPTSGVYAVLGGFLDQGFRLYLSKSGGKLGGRRVEIITEDSAGDPETGLRKAEKLVEEDRVDMATGIVSSAVALAVRDVFHERKTPLVVSNAGDNAITRDAFSEYIFRVTYANYQNDFPAGQWVYDNVAKDGMYLIAPDYTAGHEHTGGFADGFKKAGGKIIGEAFTPFGTTKDYQPYFSRIEQSGAEAVYAFYGGAEAIAFVTQAKEFGLDKKVKLCGHGALTEGLLEPLGELAMGIPSVFLYAETLDNAANKEFLELYAQAHDGALPNAFIAQAYDAGQLIDKALTAIGGRTEDPDEVVKALENVGTIESPTGDWRLEPKQHNPVRRWYMREVKKVDGKLQHVVLDDLGEFGDPVMPT